MLNNSSFHLRPKFEASLEHAWMTNVTIETGNELDEILPNFYFDDFFFSGFRFWNCTFENDNKREKTIIRGIELISKNSFMLAKSIKLILRLIKKCLRQNSDLFKLGFLWVFPLRNTVRRFKSYKAVSRIYELKKKKKNKIHSKKKLR